MRTLGHFDLADIKHRDDVQRVAAGLIDAVDEHTDVRFGVEVVCRVGRSQAAHKDLLDRATGNAGDGNARGRVAEIVEIRNPACGQLISGIGGNRDRNGLDVFIALARGHHDIVVIRTTLIGFLGIGRKSRGNGNKRCTLERSALENPVRSKIHVSLPVSLHVEMQSAQFRGYSVVVRTIPSPRLCSSGG